jgi:aminoglycoside 6'-N-acetyltransferase I
MLARPPCFFSSRQYIRRFLTTGTPKHPSELLDTNMGTLLSRNQKNRPLGNGSLVVDAISQVKNNQTTLSGRNLFPNVYEHVAQIRNLKQHPYAFYQKLGYVIVGVIPDANGLGKPDILMTKSLVWRA